MRAFLVATVLLLAVSAAACDDDNATPTGPTTTSPTTFTFASQLALRGSSSRSFTMTSAGTVKLTLSTLGNGTLTAGMGIGVLATGSPCSLAQSVITGPGSSPQMTIGADAGSYCVQVWDAGALSEDTPFSVTVEHP
jgi:hypothetical protein